MGDGQGMADPLFVPILALVPRKTYALRLEYRSGNDLARMLSIDLDAYLQRVGYRGEIAVTLPIMVSLIRSHAMSLPFENIDVQLRRPLTSLQIARR